MLHFTSHSERGDFAAPATLSHLAASYLFDSIILLPACGALSLALRGGASSLEHLLGLIPRSSLFALTACVALNFALRKGVILQRLFP